MDTNMRNIIGDILKNVAMQTLSTRELAIAVDDMRAISIARGNGTLICDTCPARDICLIVQKNSDTSCWSNILVFAASSVLGE